MQKSVHEDKMVITDDKLFRKKSVRYNQTARLWRSSRQLNFFFNFELMYAALMSFLHIIVIYGIIKIDAVQNNQS